MKYVGKSHWILEHVWNYWRGLKCKNPAWYYSSFVFHEARYFRMDSLIHQNKNPWEVDISWGLYLGKHRIRIAAMPQDNRSIIKDMKNFCRYILSSLYTVGRLNLIITEKLFKLEETNSTASFPHKELWTSFRLGIINNL